MSFFERFQGVFFSPQPTFKAVAEKPVWVDALVVVLVLFAVFSYLVAPYAQKDNLQVLKTNVKLQERMGEERYQRAIENLENPSKKGTLIRSFIVSPITLLIGFLFSSLIVLGMGRLVSTQGRYLQVFSAMVHANFVDKIIGNALRLVLILLRKSVMQTTTSLALLFPKLEVTSPAYLILSQADIFQFWLFLVFGYGLSHIFKIELKKAMIISFGFWLLKSLFYVALGLLAMQFYR